MALCCYVLLRVVACCCDLFTININTNINTNIKEKHIKRKRKLDIVILFDLLIKQYAHRRNVYLFVVCGRN